MVDTLVLITGAARQICAGRLRSRSQTICFNSILPGRVSSLAARVSE